MVSDAGGCQGRVAAGRVDPASAAAAEADRVRRPDRGPRHEGSPERGAGRWRPRTGRGERLRPVDGRGTGGAPPVAGGGGGLLLAAVKSNYGPGGWGATLRERAGERFVGWELDERIPDVAEWRKDRSGARKAVAAAGGGSALARLT